MAMVLAVAAVVLLAVSVALGPEQASPWLRAIYTAAQWIGPVLLVLAVGKLLQRRLATAARRLLMELAGPALIRAMPPRAVLEALLPWIYGDAVAHQDVVTGVLGGPGRDPAGRDTAVSRQTTAYFRLSAIDEHTSRIESTWTHDFSGVRGNHKLILFATSDPEISNLIFGERVYPLFELWLLDEDSLEDFVATLHGSLEVGISYYDDLGARHAVPPRRVSGEEVPLRHFDRYVRLSDGVDRQNLRIVDLDLYDLADPDHVVTAIENLVLRTVNNAANRGYLNWTPPHPCYVRTVVFDVRDLPLAGQKLVYTSLGSTIRKLRVPIRTQWVELSEQIEIDVNAWLLPGHSITLLWRLVQ